ncbi:MAG: ParB/RepB/Spo0J family partition protein [Bdellovibrionales bacterium]|nr:ParB/RepB/Spo0J family partition protein [Bdellovibrionales bacterium]
MENKNEKIKTRQGSGYLKQLYSTARVNADSSHSGLKGLTTFLVNFVPVDKVDASELQVRTHFDDEEIAALSHSIKEHGVLQPILVVQDGDRYKVIAGERRLRASKLAGIERIPARVLNSTDKATHEIALRENLDRVDLHPIEEGEGYVSLINAGAYSSHESIAKAFGKPKSRITECIGFTRLPEETKLDLLNKGVKSRSLLRTLLTSPVEQHPSMIAESSKNEEDGVIVTAAKGKVLKVKDRNAKSDAKPFTFEANEKKVKIPGYVWKLGEGKERLEELHKQVKKLADEIEALMSLI